MPRSVTWAARVIGVAAIGVLFVTCTETNTAPRTVSPPSFDISDGASGGNADVFFLPPLASSPSGGSYGARPANPNLTPFAKVCTLTTSAPYTCTDNPGDVANLAMTYSTTGQFYQVNWQTSSNNPLLVNEQPYRIHIFVGKLSLAYRDIIPEPSARGGSCLTSDVFCTFNNGSNLAIKVVIQSGAVCLYYDSHYYDSDPSKPCATATLDPSGSLSLLNDGVTSGLSTTATINMQPCNGDPNYDLRSAGLIDLPTFGHCVQINNLEDFDVVGTATLCNAVAEAQAAGLTATAAERMTVHRNSGDVGETTVYALPHGEASGCSIALNNRPAPRIDRMEQLFKFARRTWQTTTDRLGVWLQPAPLWACNVGGCGGVGGMQSYYQVAQPAWEAFGSANPTGDLGSHQAGYVATGVINLWDSGELEGSPEPAPEPVNNVRLHVQVNGGTPTTVLSGPPGGFANGVAQFQFTVQGGMNVVKVWGKGVGKVGDPNTFLNVFAPLFAQQYPEAQPVLLGADTLVFTANGIVPLYFNPDPPTGTIYTNSSGIATFPDFQVCTNPSTPGIPITSLEAVTNNGTYKSLDNLPTLPVVTGSDGCYTFHLVTINGTGAFRLVVNGQYTSQKFNVKPGK
jgi:hypothetical protein